MFPTEVCTKNFFAVGIYAITDVMNKNSQKKNLSKIGIIRKIRILFFTGVYITHGKKPIENGKHITYANKKRFT